MWTWEILRNLYYLCAILQGSLCVIDLFRLDEFDKYKLRSYDGTHESEQFIITDESCEPEQFYGIFI
jgi:hypothetical protein